MAYPQALFLDLLDPDLHRKISARPERLRHLIDASPEKNPVITDEIHKAPALLDLIHQLMESRRELRFIMTGSSARKLKRSGVYLHAGRALLRTFHPFMARELGESFGLAVALKRGMLPVVWGAVDPESCVASYAALYLQEEVQAEGLVRSTDGFSRFLEAIASLTLRFSASRRSPASA